MRVRQVSEAEVCGLGEQIKQARRASSKSLSTLCDEVGFSSTYWYDIENETIKGALSIKNLQAIERALETSFEVNVSA